MNDLINTVAIEELDKILITFAQNIPYNSFLPKTAVSALTTIAVILS